MISDMRLLELGDRMLVDLPSGTTSSLIERLDPFIITEDVALADVTAAVSRVSVHGPFAIEALEGICVTGGRLATLGSNESVTADIAGRDAIVARARDLRLSGLDVYLDPAIVPTLVRALAERGVPLGDAETFEVLRVEGGVPQFGVDMDHTTIPLEAGLEHEAISFTKGCYVGQEVIVRVMHRGHGRVARRLVGLRLDPGCAVTDASTDLPGSTVWHDSKEAGRVTSAAWSAALESVLALGYVARDVAEPGSVVDIRPSTGGPCSAVVSALPFLAHD
jgi:folate-binding protein YgfZ